MRPDGVFVMNALMFPLENVALEYFYRFFKNAGIIKDSQSVLSFDGIMVPGLTESCFTPVPYWSS